MRVAARLQVPLVLPLLLALACGGDPSGPSTGTLDVSVSGLPAGVPAAVTLSGPNDFRQAVTTSVTIPDLAAGTYTLAAASVTAAGAGYSPSPGTQTVTVGGDEASTTAAVAYAISTGSLAVTVGGLPAGTPAAVTVTGPGYSQEVTATTTLTGLAPGSYTVAAAEVVAASGVYTPAPPTQTVEVAAAAVPAAAAVTYAARPGTLIVTVAGLPAGAAAAIAVSGPAGLTQPVTTTDTLESLAPGSYTVTASAVEAGGKSYGPDQATQAVSLEAGTSAEVTVSYTRLTPSSLNLRIDGLYIVQSTQSYAGTVPLVAGRDGYVRVFALADAPNVAIPPVRVRLYDGATLAATYNIAAPSSSVPTEVREGTFSASWNVAVPGSLIRPGLHVVADVDPNDAVAETNEGDNVFPATGDPLALDVREVPPFDVSLVPVQQSDGRTGAVGSSNKGEYVSLAERMHPLGVVNATVHAVFSVDTATHGPADADAWGYILSQLELLRMAEATDRYYYGVLEVDYCESGGLAGLGFVSAPSAIGWDCAGGGSAGEVAAHEWGHNWGRQHSPCGGASDPDPQYPYADGKIGVFGLDPATTAIEDTSFTDIMGYCTPQWISDWTYTAILNFRAGTDAGAASRAALAAAQPCLLVWGRVVNGRPVLEPAFLTVTRPRLPRQPGPYAVEARADDGSSLFRLSFSPARIADLPGGGEAFAFAVPLESARAERLAALRLVTARGEASVSRAPAALTLPPAGGVAGDSIEARRDVAGRVALRWDAASRPAVLVRDARTGEVLSVARGGEARLATDAQDLELTLSDGVRSRTRRVPVAR